MVHHALCNVREPIFEQSFVFDSYTCCLGKGTHAAVDHYTAYARKNRYVLKCDVRKFFPSVDHTMLLERLAWKIKDSDAMWLASVIVKYSNPQEEVPGFFPGDDRVLRGGSWNNRPNNTRSAKRNWNTPDNRNNTGFHVASTALRICESRAIHGSHGRATV